MQKQLNFRKVADLLNISAKSTTRNEQDQRFFLQFVLDVNLKLKIGFSDANEFPYKQTKKWIDGNSNHKNLP